MDHSDDENENDDICPLCMEQLDESDKAFNPCSCGYKVCLFCFHKIREQNNRCPACRRPYADIKDLQPLNFEAKDARKKKKREKEKEKEKIEARKDLEHVRVIQKNLVYVSNLPTKYMNEASVRSLFQAYGKIVRVLLNMPRKDETGSAYITYSRDDEAKNAIVAKDGTVLDGYTLRVMLGLTKYCSSFLSDTPCRFRDCIYRHDLADEDCTFTLQEVREGKHYLRFGTKTLGVTEPPKHPGATGANSTPIPHSPAQTSAATPAPTPTWNVTATANKANKAQAPSKDLPETSAFPPLPSQKTATSTLLSQPNPTPTPTPTPTPANQPQSLQPSSFSTPSPVSISNPSVNLKSEASSSHSTPIQPPPGFENVKQKEKVFNKTELESFPGFVYSNEEKASVPILFDPIEFEVHQIQHDYSLLTENEKLMVFFAT